MSLAEKLQSDCKSPQEALLFLAERVEQLEDRIVHQERLQVTGWDEWSDETPPLTEWLPDPAVEARLAEAKEELNGNESDEESKALRAEILLLEDALRPPEPDPHVDTTDRAKIELEGETAIVELPKVTPEKEDARRQFANDALGLATEFGDEALEAYAKAGPLWLYYGNRDFVMGLSSDYKQIMVNDVEEQSPTEAQEMGRDILKDMDPGGPDRTVEDWKREHGAQ